MAVVLLPLDSQAVTINEYGPNWTAIEQEGQSVDFWLFDGPDQSPYGNNCAGYPYNCEVMGDYYDYGGTGVPYSIGRAIHTPYSYFNIPYSPSGLGKETSYGGCAIVQNDQGDGVYYYSGEQLIGPNTYVTPEPGSYNISPVFYGNTGTQFQGYTSGTSVGAPGYALATAYVTNHRCSDGNIEYGFYKDLTGNLTSGNPNAVVFYFSQYTNCAGSYCRNSPTYNNSSPINQLTSPLTTFTGISGSGTQFRYLAYILPAEEPYTSVTSLTNYIFRVQILDQNIDFATCTINGVSTGSQNCTVDIPINYVSGGGVQQLWPVAQMISGSTPNYLVLGAQGGTTSYDYQIDFFVEDAWLGL
jgi:hypothetical protein